MSDDVLKNIHRVHQHLRETGWKCSYGKIQADVKKGALVPRRGGGFAVQTVNQYASVHLRRAVDASPAQDAPLFPKDEGTAAEQRTKADAELKRIHARSARLAFEERHSLVVPSVVADAEITKRGKLFKLALETFGVEAAEKVATAYGGDMASARELLSALGLGEELAQPVVDWMQSRGPAFARIWQLSVDGMLDAYSRNHYLTDEMREAMAAREQKIAAMASELHAPVRGMVAELVEQGRDERLAIEAVIEAGMDLARMGDGAA